MIIHKRSRRYQAGSQHKCRKHLIRWTSTNVYSTSYWCDINAFDYVAEESLVHSTATPSVGELKDFRYCGILFRSNKKWEREPRTLSLVAKMKKSLFRLLIVIVSWSLAMLQYMPTWRKSLLDLHENKTQNVPSSTGLNCW